MDGGDVEIHDVRIVDPGGDVVGTQHRQPLEQLLGTEALEAALLRRKLGMELVEDAGLIGAADDQAAARREHRLLGEPARAPVVEAPARRGQRPDHPVAVGRGEQRGRAAGRVIARLALALEEDDAGEGRDLIRGRRAGDAGADHQDVAAGHGGSRAAPPHDLIGAC